jgi:hypothetical protein
MKKAEHQAWAEEAQGAPMKPTWPTGRNSPGAFLPGSAASPQLCVRHRRTGSK